MKFALAMIAVLCLFSSAAQARHHGHPHLGHRVVAIHQQYFVHHHRGFHRAVAVADNGRPLAWCGYFMRHEVGADPGPAYNLAANWSHWGRAAQGPAPGVIGVMPHHVFKVIAVIASGKVLAISGNDSHAVRTRVRSTNGVIAWRLG